MEVEAFRTQTVVWSALWDDDPPGRTRLERELTMVAGIVATDGEPGLYKLIVDTPDYQKTCEIWVPDPAGQTRARPATIGWPAAGAPTIVTPIPPTPPTPLAALTPVSRLTSQLAARCYTIAVSIRGEGSITTGSPSTSSVASASGFSNGSKGPETLNAVNTQCLDIADKYGDPGVDCYEPAARDFWRTGTTLLTERSESAEVANTAFVGRVASCLKGLAP
jgi:hypothetical protein